MSNPPSPEALTMLRQTTRALSVEGRSSLLLSLIRSDACIEIFARLVEQSHTDDMRTLKNFVVNNPTGFNPNPWENTRESVAIASIGIVGPGKTITSLPNELLEKIGRLIPPASRTALAITNKNLYQRMTRFWIPHKAFVSLKQKWELLQLLEHDDSHDRVACPRCFRLHHWNSERCEDIRIVASFHRHREPFIPRFYARLPKFFNYNLVHMIGRAFAKYGADSPQCSRLLQLGTKNQSMWSPTSRATRSLTNKFIDGTLVSRSQIAIAPCINGKFTGASFLELIQILTKPDFQICDHFHWPLFLEYLDDLAKGNTDGEGDGWPLADRIVKCDEWGKDGRPTESKYRFYDIWEREKKMGIVSRGENEIFTHENPTILSPALHRLFYWGFRGQVRSCKNCATDFGLGIHHIPGHGPALVMTVWRDLGGPCGGRGCCDTEERSEVRCPRKWKWDTHRADDRRYAVNNPANREFLRHRQQFCVMQSLIGRKDAGTETRGSIYKAFESAVRGVSRDALSAMDYSPLLEERDVLALKYEQPSASRPTFFNPEIFVVEEELEPGTSSAGSDFDVVDAPLDTDGDVVMGGTEGLYSSPIPVNGSTIVAAFQDLSLSDSDAEGIL